MRTIEYVDSGKQLSRSRETLELLVPHARRLACRLSLMSCRNWRGTGLRSSPGKAAGQRQRCAPFS